MLESLKKLNSFKYNIMRIKWIKRITIYLLNNLKNDVNEGKTNDYVKLIFSDSFW